MTTKDHWPLYPDLQAAGGLGPALEAEFARMGIALDVRGFGAGSWARVVCGPRFSQICLGAEERIIMPDFWADGVHMGNASTQDLSLCAKAVAAWVSECVGIVAMKDRFAVFKATDGAEAFEQGRGVDHAWGKMDGWVARDLPRLTPLVEAAKRRPSLRQLLPFTSHESLHFSRCTGYPYTNDVAHAIPLDDGLYRALGPRYVLKEQTYKDYHYQKAVYDVLGEGDADHVISLIMAALPPGCGPAIKGTADDLETAGDQ